jgi:hypothetical protein
MPDPLEPGQRHGRFEVIALLGEGGAARVYKVRHTTLGTLHAIKVVHAEHRQLRERLLREGRIQARLEHDNVVRVTDVVDEGDAISLVMDFVDGKSLHELLLDGGALPADQALALFLPVLDGVAAAHDIGALHRDLKPANILIATDGMVPKVADFGIAKDVDHAGDGLTRAGSGMGTPGYAAPEQWADSAAVDARADVFSLGAVLYEMLTGTAPFVGDTQVEVLTATVNGDHVPLGKRRPDCPAPVAAAVERALSKHADDRFANVRAFAEALAIERTAAVVLRRPPVFRLVPVVVAFALVLLCAGAVIPVTWGLMATGPDETCSAWFGRIGYWNAGPVFAKKAGDTTVLKRTVKVRDDYPRERNDFDARAPVVCELPRGTTVELKADPIKVNASWWVPVHARRVSLPDEREVDDE